MKKLNISYEKRKGLYGYGFIAIWFIGAIFFFIIPIVKSFIYSFNIVTPEDSRLSQVWAGIENYKSIFLVDPKYRQYLVQVLRDTAIQTPIILVFSLFVAIVINQEFRGRAFARSVFFLPVIIATGPVYAIITGDIETSGSASAAQFTTMFSTDMVDELLEFIGVYGLSDKFTQFMSEATGDILNLVWKCGIQIIVFLAALQGIPPSAKEVASIEGATAWEFFWKVTLSYVSPMILVNFVYTIIDTFTDPSNPVMGRIHDIQSGWEYGKAAAMAWSYFAVVLIIVGIIFALMNKIIYYDD